MIIGIPKESLAGETRVAATPATVAQLIKLGFEVHVEKGAGDLASFSDSAYAEAGAKVVTAAQVWASPLIYKVNAPSDAEVGKLKEGTTIVSFIRPAQNKELVDSLAAKKVTVLAMDMVPRISRAQSMDALSSTANISGYRAVIEAAHAFGRFFCGQITAAGKVPPAKVLVIGAGVAGLAAIGTAHSLGAIVRAFDTRPEVAEQIESMGGEFLRLDYKEDATSTDGYAKVMSAGYIKAEMDLFRKQAADVDIIITTAAIPGKKSPLLITADIIEQMKRGSVIVDMAAAGGGNCEGTVNGKVVTTKNGVKMIGYSDLACRLPTQSSQLYSTNLVNLTKLLSKKKDGNIDIDFNDVVIRNMTVAEKKEPAKEAPKGTNPWIKYGLPVLVVLFALAAHYSPSDFLAHFTVFVLSCVVGYYVVWNVTHALHTPLMSVTNAISGIIVVGAVVQMFSGDAPAAVFILAFLAIMISSINIFGGFTVTHRMLKMFRRDKQ